MIAETTKRAGATFFSRALSQRLALVGLCCLLPVPLVQAADEVSEVATNEFRDSIRRLKQMSLDEVLEQPITIVSKTAETISQAPAAVQVISSEEIRRSTATSLPEALRLSPNLQVARVSSSDWAISARGFNNTLANKLLVMIDGRTIYTPLYAGVFWDAQHVLLEDVDRIEVVSGPGGTLWGANAVNGVINVVTKSARDTQGAYVSGAVGSLLQDFVGGRYGGSIGTNFFYRAYAQRFDRNSTLLANGADAPDEWNMTQGGFRTDWEATPENTVTFQGDFYSGSKEGVIGDTTLDGQNVLGRWTHEFHPESDLQVQMYFDRTSREVPGSFAEELTTFDLDLQHRFPLGERHDIVWGGGYRLMLDRIENTPALAFLPADKDLHLVSGFIQDEITIIPERLKLAIGTKLEHNEYSGFEVQPSARMAWTPDEQQTIWGAVSRAVRSPSRIDSEVFFPAPPVPAGITNLTGNPDFDSEKLIAFELGYRVRPAPRLLVSIASYYNIYQDLRSLDQPTAGNYIIANHFKGEVWGIELAVQHQITDWWRLRAGYNYLHKHLSPHGGMNVSSSIREGNDPEHQFSFHSLVDLPGNFQFDVAGRYVSALPSPHVSSYFSFNARLAWQYRNFEISINGQDLAEDEHAEFGTGQIPRGVYGKLTWRY